LGKPERIRVPIPAANTTGTYVFIANFSYLLKEDPTSHHKKGSGARIRTWDRGSKDHCLTAWPRPIISQSAYGTVSTLRL
jgi:hypothetical protein